jgi:signal transduction histidine kinase/DNA-binding response OmpR family regulator
VSGTPSERLARLYGATTALTSEALDEEQLLRRIVEEAAGLVRARYAALGLLGTDGRLIRFETVGLTPEEFELLKDNPPHGRRGILGALLVEGRPLRLEDLTADPRSTGFPPGHPPMRSFLGVPLHLSGDVIGRLYMTEAEQGAFDEEDEHTALGFAAAASVALGNARLNAALRERSQAATVAAGQLRATLDALERGVCMTDAEGRIALANEPLAVLLALDASAVGLRERDLADRFAAPEAFVSALVIESAQPRVSSTDEFEVAETGLVVRRFGRPILTPDGHWLGRVAIYADVTQERELQEQLVAAERLRATGEMASGVAHDFNNLLATILGRVEVVLGQSQDEAVHENVLAIQRAARDGAATVARMREYGRPLDAGEFKPVSLERVVREAVELTQPRWRDQAQREGRTIAVGLQLQPARPVLGDAVALREVLVNLIFNAVDAMPEGGDLTLTVQPAGAGAELTVRDSGHGMPPAVQRRIFEPFFTTKGERGSGLGLAMVQKVVASHGGRVDVHSAPGSGTTFTIWLPATEAPAEDGSAPSAQPARDRVARIVVIDDQRDVLDTTAMLLRGHGHDVRAFQDPRAGVEAALDDRPDLVISDLGMPGMNGWDVARAVHARHPDLPVILLTGWGREISATQMREGGIAAVLPKPVEGPALREAVASALPGEERPVRVLIVDDSAAFAAVLAMLIGQAGHAVERVETGQAGLAALASGEHDLLLVDLGLPDRPAIDLIAAARVAPGRPAVCVVSGSAIAEMERSAPGADLYVEKVRVPERLDDLVALARRRVR